MRFDDKIYTVRLTGSYDMDAEILTTMLLSQAYGVSVDEATSLFASSLYDGEFLPGIRDFEFTKSFVEQLIERGGECMVQAWNEDGSAAHDKFGPFVEEGSRFLFFCRHPDLA